MVVDNFFRKVLLQLLEVFLLEEVPTESGAELFFQRFFYFNQAHFIFTKFLEKLLVAFFEVSVYLIVSVPDDDIETCVFFLFDWEQQVRVLESNNWDDEFAFLSFLLVETVHEIRNIFTLRYLWDFKVISVPTLECQPNNSNPLLSG